MNRQSGLTLIEVVTVVMVLGVLALVFLPTITRALTHAKEAAVKSNAHVTQVAVESAAIDTPGHVPVDVSAFVSTLPDSTGLLNPFTGAKELPIDGEATAQGVIGYEVIDISRYRITGFGEGELVVDVGNASGA